MGKNNSNTTQFFKKSAKHISTKKNWADLSLDEAVQQKINAIHAWMQDNRSTEIHKKSGFKALFIGPKKTGKKLVAKLLGNQYSRDVYRVNLSRVVSKYIGETEKNLDRIFDRSAEKNWILFFDEADALFGKRSEVKDSHDRYANLETSYFLRKSAQYNGLVILNVANNLNSENGDESFDRFCSQFDEIIHFTSFLKR